MANTANMNIVNLFEELSDLLNKLGEPFRAKAYKSASNAISTYQEEITKDTDLNSIKGLGKTTIEKVHEILETGHIKYVDELKQRPQILFTNVYGIGPKKAKELADKGYKTILELSNAYSENKSILNDKQAIGIKYYNDIMERIPRHEINEFKSILEETLSKNQFSLQFEIVGSYRRGAETSGDIDVILTTTSPEQSSQIQSNTFKKFLDVLSKNGTITHFLSQGPTKSLVVGKVNDSKYYRRIDFLYTKPPEYPYAILYFTGSKYFNLGMRSRALKHNMSLNEHCFSDIKTKNKIDYPNVKREKDIFDILNMEYKEPTERIDGNSVEDKHAVEDKHTVEGSNQSVETVNTLETNEPLKNIEKFKQSGQSFLETQSIQTLQEMISTANHYYFNEQPIMTDNEYDIIKEYIEDNYPDTEFDIGAPVSQGKVKLSYPMPSMNKKKDEKSINKWFEKYPPIHNETQDNKFNYLITAKLDGVSAMFCNENGEQRLYTRGDGISGQDITHMVKYLPQLGRISDKKVTLRGELLIKKETFEKRYRKHFRNPRNFVSGLVNQTKDLESKDTTKRYKDIDFVCYEVISPTIKPEKQIEIIRFVNGKDTGLNEATFITKPTISELSEYLKDWRTNYKYEIDGIIVAFNTLRKRENKNPDDAFAFKMALTDQTAETFVTDVIWTASKDGYLKPRVRFSPVKISGVDIEYATGFNGAYIRDNCINIGTKIEVIRSGDVIPYINSVITPSETPKMPEADTYKWNKTKIDIILQNPKDDPTICEKVIESFFKTMEIPNIGKGVAKQLVDSGYTTIESVVNLTVDDYLEIPGFKKTKSEKLYNAIQDKLYSTESPLTFSSLPQLMAASNLMGRGISTKTIASILETYPTILTSDESSEEKIDMCTEVKGVQLKTCKPFVRNIPKFIKFVKALNLEHTLDYNSEKLIKTPKLTGEPHMMTGFRSKELEDYLAQHNIPLASTLSKKVKVLYVNTHDYSNSKTDKATELNIPIVVYTNTQELEKILNNLKIV